MTAPELQTLFEVQLSKQPRKMFYMKQQGGPEVHQITASVLTHDSAAGTWDDLLADLVGYTYQDSVGDSKWPRFVKDTA